MEFSAYINDETPVLVDFYTKDDPLCNIMHPVLQELKSAVGSSLKIIKINIDRNPELALSYKVKRVPTLILFQEGKMRWRWWGVVRPDELLRTIVSSEQPAQIEEYRGNLY